MSITESLESGPHHRMTDHPGWRTINGERRRAFRVDGHQVIVSTRDWRDARDAGHLEIDTFGIEDTVSDTFAMLIASLGTAERVRNPSLWDAIGTAIIRQVIRAPQAKKMYQGLCSTHGDGVLDVDGAQYWLFPSPQQVLDLTEHEFRELGMAFKRKGLRSAAAAYLEMSEDWALLPPETLVNHLQAVPHIGPWTAKAAVADFTNQWALYPYDDLAVRTWARRAMPSVEWAGDEAGFGLQWRELGGDHIADVTLLTLAWGDRHGATQCDGTSGWD